MLSESTFGQTRQFRPSGIRWKSCSSPITDAPFVSQQYRAQLDGAGGRAAIVAIKDCPQRCPNGPRASASRTCASCRSFIIIDLLTLERDARARGEIADDMTALAEDL